MRIRNLLSIVDLEKVDGENLKYTLRRVAVAPDTQSPAERDAFLSSMYGDEAGDLDLEQKREDLRKTRAQADKLSAEAAKARSDIGDHRVDRWSPRYTALAEGLTPDGAA